MLKKLSNIFRRKPSYILRFAADRNVNAIKSLRSATGLGIEEALDIVKNQSVPSNEGPHLLEVSCPTGFDYSKASAERGCVFIRV